MDFTSLKYGILSIYSRTFFLFYTEIFFFVSITLFFRWDFDKYMNICADFFPAF
jgi:hypothetical protein